MYGESGKLQTTIYELSFRYPAGFPQEVWRRLERLAGPFVVRKDGWPADFESAMKRLLISVLLGAVIQPALAGERSISLRSLRGSPSGSPSLAPLNLGEPVSTGASGWRIILL